MEPLASAAFGREGRGFCCGCAMRWKEYFSPAKGAQGGEGKAPWSPPQRRNPLGYGERQERLFPLPSTRNAFLVEGFDRLRADEVLSPRGKVPKGRRGRPKDACGVAAPGPPVAKEQCTASLAGARPARFTSVPGRATVAFGAADPSPGSWAPVYPWSGGKEPPRQEYLATVRVATKTLGKVRGRCGTRLVAGSRQNRGRARYGPCRSRNKGKYPFRHKGGPGVSLGRLKGV